MGSYCIVLTDTNGGRRRVDVGPGATMVLGRDPGCDLVLLDPTVSRRHALVQHVGGELWIEELGSAGGTSVNGQPLVAPRQLRTGDTVDLAAARVRVVDNDAEQTQLRPPTHASHHEVGQQSAAMINNVGRDQHLSYVQHVQQQRASFAREIAATRTKARVLVWLGLALTVVGVAGFLWVWSQMAVGITGLWEHPDSFESVFSTFFGPRFLGVPAAAWAMAASTAGELMVVVGIVLHVVATARRRRVDRELPVPPPWTRAT